MIMKYNLSAVNLLSVGTGTKALTSSELYSLVDGNQNTSSVTVSGSEQLSLVLDLKARYSMDELVYYWSPATIETIVIQAKQNDLDIWTELATTTSGARMSATLSGTYDRYQIINIVHSVSEGVAYPLEVEAYTDDSKVKFGSSAEGIVEEYPVSSGADDSTPQEVFIRNDTDEDKDYFILIETSGSSNLVEVSYEENGPYFPLRGNSVDIPTSYSWASGVFDSTQVDGSDRVVVSTSTSGTYYSPIIDISSFPSPRIFWCSTSSGTSVVDDYLNQNAQDTIGVRVSDISPESPWISGQTSSDSTWDTASGTLTFNQYANNTILPPAHKNYVQFMVQLNGDTSYPKLDYVGLEYPLVVTVSGASTDSVFVRTVDSSKDGNAELVVWYFESKNMLS